MSYGIPYVDKDINELNSKIGELTKQKDQAYSERNKVAAALAHILHASLEKYLLEGLPFLENYQYDGHTTDEKYKRLFEFAGIKQSKESYHD